MNNLRDNFAPPLREFSNKFDGLQSDDHRPYHDGSHPQQRYSQFTHPPPSSSSYHQAQQSSRPRRQQPHYNEPPRILQQEPHRSSNSNSNNYHSDPRTHLLCSRHEIRNLNKDLMIMQVLRPSKSSTWALSQRPTITLIKANGIVFGHIKFRSISSSVMELEINNRSTKMVREDFEDNWSFRPSFMNYSRGEEEEVWSWEMEENERDGVLVGRRGVVLARLYGERLVMEIQGMSDVEYDEIVVSGVAVVEKSRKGTGISLSGFGDVVEAVMKM